jgi:hypothetical protein
MCQINLESASTIEIVRELERRGLITDYRSNGVILNNLNENSNLKFILSWGIPTDKYECRECRETLDAENFNYYQSRVDQKGFLWRRNALCRKCDTKSNRERKDVLDIADVPDEPKKGDECPRCKRNWNGRWHRHHEGDQFIEWLCLHCNTHLSDQRNKLV